MNRIKTFKPQKSLVSPPRFGEATPKAGEARSQQPEVKTLRLIPLGGVGDVTKNMYVYEYGQDILLIDCGVGFPSEEMLGIDLVIPDISYLQDKKDRIRGLVITHGHEDHIGGLPYLWPKLSCPIFAQKLAAAFIRDKFAEFRLPKEVVRTVEVETILKLGVFTIRFYQVTHAVPDSVGVIIDTPVGKILHQSDFKIDWTPVSGQVTEVGKVAQEGDKGVLLMLIDALKTEKPGYNPSEKTIQPTFERVEKDTKGKLLITMTSSNITRIQQAINVAVSSGRKLMLVGRSMESNFQTAHNLGYLDVPPRLVVPMEEVKHFPDHKLLILIAGSQGQPGSALSRVANSDHRFVSLEKDDAVVFSADPIPSTEAAQNALIDQLTKMRVDVYYPSSFDPLHVSVLPHTEVLIRDQRGQVKLEEIQKVKEEVEAYTFDRKYCTTSWQKAQSVKHHYEGTVYKITTKSGRSVEMTKGHSLFTLKNCQIVEVKSENLQIGDFVVIPKLLSIPESQRAVDFTDWLPGNNWYSQKDGFIFHGQVCIAPVRLEVNNEFNRLLGYYLAEGSAPRHLSLVLNKDETDLIDELKRIINNLLRCTLRTQIRGNALEVTFATPFLGRIFKEWFGKNALSKRIPSFVFTTSEEQKLNFLGAYINGDGAVDKGKRHSRIRIKTSSKKLVSDLLYLFSSVGIIARLDHIQRNPARLIGKYQLRPTSSYVIRIQRSEYIQRLLPYLSKKFQDYFTHYYDSPQRVNYSQTYPPEALPVQEIELLKEVIPRHGTTLATLYSSITNNRDSLTQLFVNPNILIRDAVSIGNPLTYYINGNLLFDPITKIEVLGYKGPVYDLSVAGPENFLGGFGGIFLHNSGHAAREEVKLMIGLARPKYLMPIGATFKQMKFFAKVVAELGYGEDQVMLAEDGRVIKVTQLGVSLGELIPTKNIYVDGLGVGDVGSVVLRDRQVMADEGVVIVMMPIDAKTGNLAGEVDIISRGFVFEKEAEELLHQAKIQVEKVVKRDNRGGVNFRFIKRSVEETLEKFFYEKLKRQPLILPVLVEV